MDFAKFSFSMVIEDIKMGVILFYLCNLIKSEQIIMESLDNNFLSKETVMEIIMWPLIEEDKEKLETIGLFVKIFKVKPISVIDFIRAIGVFSFIRDLGVFVVIEVVII